MRRRRVNNMYYYMFGIDSSDTESFADSMKDKGINAVVAGGYSGEQLEIFASRGLDCWLCFGAFSRGGYDDSHLAVDFNGQRRVWFGSACPSDTEISSAHMKAVIDAAKTNGIRGIFSDGARYASFASPEGFDSFYTCFCDKCLARAEKFGIDLAGAREACKKGDFAAALPVMIEFRCRAVKEWFDEFYRECKAASPSLQVGAFIFPASLAPYVGQRDVTEADILAPMLYRDYPQEQGPACLNFEWNAAAERAHISWKERGFKTKAHNDAELLHPGFEPEQLRDETAAVLGKTAHLMPIIQLDDDRLAEAIDQIKLGGADGCGFLAYSRDNMRFMKNVKLD